MANLGSCVLHVGRLASEVLASRQQDALVHFYGLRRCVSEQVVRFMGWAGLCSERESVSGVRRRARFMG